jgi:hypothetical protein
MAYRIGADEPVRAAIVRCGREQLDTAIRELSEGVNEDPVGRRRSGAGWRCVQGRPRGRDCAVSALAGGTGGRDAGASP